MTEDFVAIKTEHGCAKHTHGYWGRKVEAKHVCSRLRRQNAKKEIRQETE